MSEDVEKSKDEDLVALDITSGVDTVLSEDDFRDVCRELVTIRARYYQLGVELGLPPGELEAVKKEYPQDVDQAFNEVVLRWLRQRYDVARFGLPTWKRLVEAVSNPAGADNPALALEIASKHPELMEKISCVQQPLRTVTRDLVTPEATTRSNEDDKSQLSLSAPDSMLHRNMVTIQAKFASPLVDVQIALESKKVVVAHVHQFMIINQILINSSEVDVDVSSCTEFSVVFKVLTKRKVWSYEHYTPLEMLVKKFLPDNSEIQEQIKLYKNDLSGFLVTTKLIDYIKENPFTDQELEKEEENSTLPQLNMKQYRSLKVVLNLSARKVSELSLDYVRELWEKFAEEFDLPQLTTVIKKIVTGSLEITWLVSIDMVETIMHTSRTSKSARFFHQLKIVSLVIDGVTVYDDNQMMDREKQFFEVCSLLPTDFEEVSALLELGVDPDAENSDGETGLNLACKNGQKAVAKLLIKKGASVYCQSKVGFTPLHYASRNGNIEVVQLLIDKGAHVDVLAKDEEDNITALILACICGHKAVAELLIQKGANVNYQEKAGFTALHHASRNSHFDVVEMLTEKGAHVDVPAKDEKNCITALSLACKNGHKAIVELLIQKGANVNYQNKVGLTALHYASRYRHFEVVKMLSDRGAHVDVPAKDERYTALILACKNGHKAVVELLIQKGANVNYQNKIGFTALHYASQYGHFDVVKLLTEKGAHIDVPAKDENNCTTALSLACIKGHKAIVEFLIQKGANINYQNKSGLTAVDLATFNGHTDVVQLLIDHNADFPSKGLHSEACLPMQSRSQHEVTSLKTFRKVLEQGLEPQPDYTKYTETSDSSNVTFNNY